MENKLNIIFKTSPRITSQDSKNFAELALGNETPSRDFCSSVDLNSGNNSFEEVVASSSVQPTLMNVSDIVIIPVENLQQNERNIKKKINTMKQQFNRLADIPQANSSPNNLMILRKLNKVLSDNDTTEQAKNFVAQRVKLKLSRSQT
ncbi:unnamed protein product [Parnassius apollo]|uniref:(apollo) hypothetical protein n=1 Tax=Parnassius apollo TaxID=110799 RepID=A0A8S3W2E3_PARAO|nr:unnamed protein product [Parnassius apollo]